jgi:two-component system, NarL family, nitrate/nitrite response regulator NarL
MTMTVDRPADAEVDGTKVLLVEDHQLVGETLRGALTGYGFEVALSTCTSAGEILAEARSFRPRLVVLDLELGGAGDGRDLIKPLVELGAAVLVLSGVTDRLELARCLEAGAVGLASKGEPFSSVLDKVRRAMDGEMVTPIGDRVRYQSELDEARRAERRRLAPFQSLSPRERDVLALIVDGRPAAEIARRSYVSLPTVRTQIRSILQKLDVNSQMAAAAMARSAGWAPEPQAGLGRQAVAR